MIELYHHGSSVCAAKVRLVLAEKGLDWKGHYVDILNRLDMLGMSKMWTRSRPRLADWVRAHQGTPHVQTLLSRLLPSRSDERPEDLWLAELAGSPRDARGDMT